MGSGFTSSQNEIVKPDPTGHRQKNKGGIKDNEK